MQWSKVPSQTKWKQPAAHLPGCYLSSTSCSLLGDLPLSKFLGFWNAAHLPSPAGKHNFTINSANLNPISPLWKDKS